VSNKGRVVEGGEGTMQIYGLSEISGYLVLRKVHKS
jgi:hypothetical protein